MNAHYFLSMASLISFMLFSPVALSAEAPIRDASGWCLASKAQRIPDDVVGWINGASNNVVKFPEHPDGKITWTMNSYGFREKSETSVKKAPNSTRILVTGDSHMEGATNNEETFANRLEGKLNRPGRAANTFDVLSGGVAYYTFRNYLGYLKKFLFLKPDVFIQVVFTGNDFLEEIKAETCGNNPWATPAYTTTLQQALVKGHGAALWQGENQAFLFRNDEAASHALSMAVRYTKEVKELCDREKIKFLVVLLPTKMDTERASDLVHIEHVEQLLGMKPTEGDINRKITLRYAAELEKMKVAYLDPYEQMRKTSKELFYKIDYHLNVNGHDVLADIVLGSRFIHKLSPEKVSMNLMPSRSAVKRPLKDHRRRKFQGGVSPLGENRS